MRTLKVLAVWTIFLSALGSAPPAPAQQQVLLGNSVVELTGPWKFHIGDNLAWASPSFDDSGWDTMDLTPPAGSYDPLIGSSGFVPGWTARGYHGYSGYAWYRLRTNVQNGQTQLALKMPNDFDDACQVYVNGRLIGEFGRFTARGVTMYSAQPRAFLFPVNVRGGLATIAIRMWMTTSTPLEDPDAGGLHGPPVLGQSSAIAGLLQLDWDAFNRANYGEFLQIAILLQALLVAFGLFWLDRTEPAYLWLGLACAAMLALMVVIVTAGYTTWVGGTPGFLLTDAVLPSAIIALWVLFWAYWFRLDHMRRLHRMVWGLAVLLGIGMAMLRAPLYGGVVPVHAIVWLSPLTLAFKLLLGVLLVWVTVRGIQKNKAEGWLALPAVVLVVISRYSEELLVLHVPIAFSPFGIGIGVNTAAIVLSLVIITVLLLRRFLHSQRENARIRTELQQARQVQEMLIPKHPAQVPGFTIDSVYLPAEEVGGDFFQVLPGVDGSLLVVVGDVSGKGLKAAMLVASIVGGLKQIATREPAQMLAALNRQLCAEMAGGFVTCCALLFSPEGELTLANAGHLPPYLNGKEMPVEGALPLGIVESAAFKQTRFPLEPGDRLTVLTDGVVEARNTDKELFGFARTNNLVRKENSAASVAAAAQAFGQEDDITVLTIQRVAAPVLAAA